MAITYSPLAMTLMSKGFFVSSNDGANAAKAQCLYIKKYGKKGFLKVQTRLHEKYEFQKVQEILGQDYEEALRILEENGEGSS